MAKKSALIFGVILIIFGIWGFFQQPLFGIFAADTISSLVHIIAGITLLMVASSPKAVKTLKTIGIIYFIFAVVGFFQSSSVFGLFEMNSASTWLYFVIGIVLVILGWSSGKELPTTPTAVPQM